MQGALIQPCMEQITNALQVFHTYLISLFGKTVVFLSLQEKQNKQNILIGRLTWKRRKQNERHQNKSINILSGISK